MKHNSQCWSNLGANADARFPAIAAFNSDLLNKRVKTPGQRQAPPIPPQCHFKFAQKYLPEKNGIAPPGEYLCR
mgnify:CR=1 FL=1